MRPHRLLPIFVSAALALCAVTQTAQSAAVTSSAPVIHETFALLACPSKPKTTLQIEGCAEHRVVAIDKTIDALSVNIFAKLRSAGRRAYAEASADWLTYRNTECDAEASIYDGGSIQPVDYADCLIAIDRSHVGELRAMLVALSPAG